MPNSDRQVRAVARATWVVLVTAFLWITAAVVAVGAVISGTPDSDTGEHSTSSQRLVAYCIAAILVAVSGPVAYVLGKQRWLLALPLVGVGILAVGIGVAIIT